MPIQPPRVTLLKSNIAKLGGLEKYAFRLASAFNDKNLPVTILTTGEVPSHLAASKMEIHSQNISTSTSYKKTLAFDHFCQDHLSRHPSEIVFGMDRNSFQTHLRAGNGVHAAYLKSRSLTDPFYKRLSYSANPLHHLLLQLEKKAFEHPDLKILFTNSHMVRDEVLTHYNTDPKKIQVIHNGVEWHEMESAFRGWQEHKKQFAQEIGLDPHLFQFLFIGHNYHRKGLEHALRGLALIPHRNFHLSVIGKEKKPGYFIALANRLGLSNCVTFFGERRDTRSFYALADSLIIPSFYDPFANVTVEALAMGLFVVSSDKNGGKEVLTETNGIVIESLLSSSSVAAALTQAMSRPKTLAQAEEVRNSVAHLDFSLQLPKFIHACLV